MEDEDEPFLTECSFSLKLARLADEDDLEVGGNILVDGDLFVSSTFRPRDLCKMLIIINHQCS